MQDSSWTILGDFNVIQKPEERDGGDTSWPNYMEELNECCLNAHLDDLRFTGQLYTWSKGSGEGFLARKLDRALVNHSWPPHSLV